MRARFAILGAMVLALIACDDSNCRTESQYEGGVLKTEIKICRDSSIANYRSFYRNGAVRQVKVLKNGMTQGKAVTYDSLGVRMWTGEYEQDTLNGPYVDYYPSGSVQTKSSFLKGRQDGTYTSFYENGKVRTQAEFENGKQVGEFREYHPNGVLLMRAHYEHGFPIEYVEYDSLGVVISSKRTPD